MRCRRFLTGIHRIRCLPDIPCTITMRTITGVRNHLCWQTVPLHGMKSPKQTSGRRTSSMHSSMCLIRQASARCRQRCPLYIAGCRTTGEGGCWTIRTITRTSVQVVLQTEVTCSLPGTVRQFQVERQSAAGMFVACKLYAEHLRPFLSGKRVCFDDECG